MIITFQIGYLTIIVRIIFDDAIMITRSQKVVRLTIEELYQVVKEIYDERQRSNNASNNRES